ncbi:hypothetical protein PM082_006223 [Marasmius tenuissimus]|nr:hypothetical protein PM082_006223 [Marasmius tenuissimus]
MPLITHPSSSSSPANLPYSAPMPHAHDQGYPPLIPQQYSNPPVIHHHTSDYPPSFPQPGVTYPSNLTAHVHDPSSVASNFPSNSGGPLVPRQHWNVPAAYSQHGYDPRYAIDVTALV